MQSFADIRKRALKITQTKVAEITGASQGTVSRWETGELEPSFSDLAKLRVWAAANERPLNDAWLFDGVPPTVAA